MPFGKPGIIAGVPKPQNKSRASLPRGRQFSANTFPPPEGPEPLHEPVG